ncbi:MAG: helix-turn-helix domain-containing protein, partial [Firmicutes bacterium]|nr:helix-turn-helix domain-containing protein [Bacillota bacterium]
MNKGVKFRIYPNRQQKDLINQTLGCCRLIYNKGLAMRKDSFENGLKIGYKETSAMLTKLKRDDNFLFLKEVDSIALQQSLRDLDKAYK